MRKKTLLMALFCALCAAICWSPPAQALIVGFNDDIHMDIRGDLMIIIADDFHVEGRIE